MEMLKETLRI